MLVQRNIGFVRVTTPRAFGRAGIRFAAGATELDLLDLSAQQIIALANEPMFVFEGRRDADDDWKVFPVPTPADLPALEADLALAKAMIAQTRGAEGPIADAIAALTERGVAGLSDATKLALAGHENGAHGLAIMPGDGIGELGASIAAAIDAQLATRLAAEAGRPDDDTDKPEEGAAASPARAATEAGAASAPASGTAAEGDATSNTTAHPAPNPPPAPNPAPEAAQAAEAQAPARAAGKAKPAK